MADVKGLVNDPDFDKLDLATKKQALGRMDPDLGNLSDQDVQTFINRMKAQAPPQEQPPLQAGAGDAATSLMKGIGAGLATNVVGARDIAARMFNTPGGPQPVPDLPRTRAFAQGTGQDAMFNVGKGVEQGAEFFLPGGEISKGVEAAGRFGKIPELAARIGLEAGSAGAIEGLHSGGDPDAMKSAALQAGVTSGILSTIGGVLKSIPPETIYRTKALKIPATVPMDQIQDVFKQAVENRIPLTRGGLAKNRQFMQDVATERNAYLAAHANDPLPLSTIMAPVGEMLRGADTIGDPEMKAQIQKIWDNLSERYGAKPGTPATPGTPSRQIPITGANGQPMIGPNGQPLTKTIPGTPGSPATPATPPTFTVADGENVKEELYKVLASHFEKLSQVPEGKNATRAAEAKGLKMAIEQIVPEVAGLNQRYKNAKILDDALEDFLRSDRYVTKPEAAVAATLGTAGLLTHTLHYSIPGIVLYEALSNPRVRAALAIMKAASESGRTGQILGNIPQTAGRITVQTLAPPVPQQPKQ